ncbi:mucin-2-like [Ornithodoros turicata]|uniref:mucin-2-like n=1 Tax=Ornithodoros turicata TaxID=34597 RepID=UPI00313A48AB
MTAAFKAVSPTPWVEALPIVLLSLRATVRRDIECAPAELVYGTALRLPGDLFSSSSTTATPDFASYADRLRATMQDLRPTPPSDLRLLGMPIDTQTSTPVPMFLSVTTALVHAYSTLTTAHTESSAARPNTSPWMSPAATRWPPRTVSSPSSSKMFPLFPPPTSSPLPPRRTRPLGLSSPHPSLLQPLR